jgi:hypothetical protein
MPTAHMPGCNLLHHFLSPEVPILWFAPAFKQAKFPEQRFGLLCVHLQRYMRLLHTFLLESLMGFKERVDILMGNGSYRADKCQGAWIKFHLALTHLFCYI